MKSLLNQIFDKVVCISLLEREDKKEIMQQKFNNLNIDVEWYRPVIHGFNKNIVKHLSNTENSKFNSSQYNEIGTSLSHYNVVKTALLQDVKQLFVFEDDCLFHKDWETLLHKYFDTILPNWDMIMFYSFMYNLEKENIRVRPRWTRAYNSWSLTSYGMNRKMMEEYIKYADNFFTIADLVTYNLQKKDYLNIYVTTPPLTIPNVSLGSNIRKEMNYENTPSVIMLGVDKTNYI
jgi:GR25 family glycosyltransferase involved in LPS biosynthesis